MNIIAISILLLLFFSCMLFPQQKSSFPDPKFEYLTINDGLPENTVLSILQDKFGYLWLGTHNGLVRYDGYTMKDYYHDDNDSLSLTDNRTWMIYEDRSGTSWMGSYSGLDRFDRKTETFTQYIYDDFIFSMIEDSTNQLWALGETGLYHFDSQNNRFNLHQFQDTTYVDDVYEYFLSLKKNGKIIASISNVGDNADLTKSFFLKQKTPVYIVIVGESFVDYGWLENDRGKIIYSYDLKSTYYAGGRADNRIQIIKTELNAGDYKLRYKSDESHSYKTWADPPTFQEFWGIQIFPADSSKEDFKKDLVNISTMGFSAATFDSSTGIAIIGSYNGLYNFNPTTKNLEVLTSISSTLVEVRKIFRAGNGTIWIGHKNGLISYNPVTKTSRIISEIQSEIRVIGEDQDGFIWCYAGGTAWFSVGNQLIIIDPVTGGVKKSDSNIIRSIYKDNSGIMWLGTGWEGLKKWDKKKNKFNIYNHDPDNSNSISSNVVNSVAVDSNNILWIGTNEGLEKFDRLKGVIKHYKFNNEEVTVVHINNKDKSIWLGTKNNGLVRFDPVKETIHYYSYHPDDSTSISSNYVFGILTDQYDNFWVGSRNDGLNLFNSKTGKFKRYKVNPDGSGLLSNLVISLYEDPDNILWIATNLGLNRYNRESDNFSHQKFTKAEISGLTNTATFSAYQDSKGNFWIANFQTGLHLFDKEKLTAVKNFTANDGLAANVLINIREDSYGNLWIKTFKGLSKFNPETEIFRNYYYSDGLPAEMTGPFFAYQSHTGEIFIPGYNGLVYFHPDSIKDDPTPPKVVISSLSLFNREDEALSYDGFISEIKEVSLPYNHNDLHFDFVALHFGEPSKNNYKYILEGFDIDWVDAGTQRNATYTNLSPGEYIFRVIACNRDGVWNEEGASLKIIIFPPFWATWWAYTFYVIFFGLVLYGIRKYEMNRIKLKDKIKLDEAVLKEREETDKMKSRFFANISHEFRTPLTLILGPTEKIILSTKEEETQKQTGLIKRNASRLLNLVNQLLDLSKLEAGKLQLQASKGNIVSFVRGVTMSFESLAERKDIKLKVTAERNDLELYFDRNKMAKILANLLSNAFKFTGEGGEIIVALTPVPSSTGRGMSEGQGEGEVQIKVTDTGIGISEEELPKLFDRFYQVDSSQTREHEGTGIGLALTKELVELHHGKIKVTSKVGAGSEFIVVLPVGRGHLREDEIVEKKESEIPVILIPQEREKNLIVDVPEITVDSSRQKEGQASKTQQNVTEEGQDKTIILIVEDNAEVREYIKDSLGSSFTIEIASNGEQGLKKATEIIPDLIISDIMMPKMDGNELTRIIKNDERTSHIPVILLTAKSEQESKLEGLETGADDYLTKPFDTKELLIRIKNLISIRRKLHEKFSDGKIIYRKGEKKLSLIDEKFLTKSLEVAEKHLSEEEFSIEQFAKEIGMDRFQLHRKLKALTGKSPSLYLRSVRLSKAKKMIEEKTGNISEIAYSVGFSSPVYFSACFKDEFGYPPREVSHK